MFVNVREVFMMFMSIHRRTYAVVDLAGWSPDSWVYDACMISVQSMISFHGYQHPLTCPLSSPSLSKTHKLTSSKWMVVQTDGRNTF
jgi:hypothetical protein